MFEDFTVVDYSAIEQLDLFVAGFPCQAFSMAGKRKGFDEVRGTLFFNCAEFIRINQPKYFILENVKGLLSHDKPKGSKNKTGRTFGTIINLLSKTINNQTNLFPTEGCLEYNIHWQVLNSKNFGVPQNRERVFIVGIRKDLPNHFRFPIGIPLELRLKDILESKVDEKYYLSEKLLAGFSKHNENHTAKKTGFIHKPKNGDEIAGCIRANAALCPTDNTISEKSEKIGFVNQDTQASAENTAEAISPTLSSGTHGYAQGYIEEPLLCREVRTAEAKKQRRETGTNSFPRKELELVKSDTANCIQTGLTKDNLIAEPTLQKIAQINGKHESSGRIYSPAGLSPTVTAKQGGGHEPFTQVHNRIRRLTPLECFRLQGFPDDFIKPCSDTQTYKQAGNSITVHVIKAVIKNLLQPLG
jgi:DNA (cytosine-5)-methyltransferase 1